jgi:hypothetical protein
MDAFAQGFALQFTEAAGSDNVACAANCSKDADDEKWNIELVIQGFTPPPPGSVDTVGAPLDTCNSLTVTFKRVAAPGVYGDKWSYSEQNVVTDNTDINASEAGLDKIDCNGLPTEGNAVACYLLKTPLSSCVGKEYFVYGSDNDDTDDTQDSDMEGKGKSGKGKPKRVGQSYLLINDPEKDCAMRIQKVSPITRTSKASPSQILI